MEKNNRMESVLARLDSVRMPPPRSPPMERNTRDRTQYQNDPSSPQKRIRPEIPFMFWIVTITEYTNEIHEWVRQPLQKLAIEAICQLEMKNDPIYYRNGCKIVVDRLVFQTKESMEECYGNYMNFSMSVQCGAIFGEKSMDYSAYTWKMVYDKIHDEKFVMQDKDKFHDKLTNYAFSVGL
jgi:hypothetical protein